MIRTAFNLLFLAITLLSPIIAPANAAPASTDVRLGAILYLTGDVAMYAEAFRRGIELAIDAVNTNGGIGGRKVTLYLENADGTSRGSNTAARKLLTVSKVHAILLQSYVDVMASKHEFERARVPVITLWDSNPEIDAAGDYIFAIGPWTPSAGEVAAAYSRKQLNARRVIVIANAETWSEGVAKVFKERFEALGGRVDDSLTLGKDDVDFRTVLTRVKSLDPDLIYTPLVYNLVPFYTQLHQLKWPKPVVSSDIIGDEHVRQAPEAFEGIYQTSIRQPSSDEYEKLARRYEEQFKDKIALPWFVAAGFDGATLLLDAVRRTGTDGTRIKDELYKVKDYPGASGAITISSGGSCPVFEVMYRIEKSKFTLAE